MVSPWPPDFHSPGDIAWCVTKRSCSRPGPDRPTSNAASSTLAESRNSRRACSSVSACRKALGVIAAQRRNRWCNSFALTPAAAAIASISGCARQCSETNAMARRTTAWSAPARLSGSQSSIRSGESMAISIVCSLSKTEADGRPPDFCRYLIKDCSGRPSLGLAECCRERKREAFFLPRAQETCDCKPPSSRDEEQSFNAELGVHDSIEPNPERIERPFADPAGGTHVGQGGRLGGE